MKNKLLIGLIFSSFLAGCQKEAITVTDVSKESGDSSALSVAPLGPAPTAPAPDHGIKWVAPYGWEEKDPSAMRAGSFSAFGSDGQKVDISIIPLVGQAGGVVANLNRWRGQINLPPLEDGQIGSVTSVITLNGKKMVISDFVSEDLLVEQKWRKRIMAAIYETEGKTWFFKMTGEDRAVRENEEEFIQFLESLEFRE